ncbi:MAG: recombination regulator RecX [Betaproteobacteria bacterium]|nr:recombination regulator RecX [Betaproteobacteria bacterium]
MKARPDGPQRSLRLRAVGLLARREHSRAELVKKLGPLGSTEEINAVLDQLEQTGLLSDARAAHAYVRGHAARFGVAKLKYNLRSKGIGDELIAASLTQEGMTEELQRARELWRRKFGKQPSATASDAKEWARQARFLQSRGFSTEIIRKLLKAPDDE